MRVRNRNKHVIDLVFPIALFFVFVVSALMVVMLAANVYGNNTDALQVNDESRTALSYVSEKVRQSDAGGGMKIIDIEGTQCLSLPAEYGGNDYVTYIYKYGGALKELFVRNDAPISLKSGTDIAEISDMSMEEEEKGLYRFTIIDSEGKASSLTLAERSDP